MSRMCSDDILQEREQGYRLADISYKSGFRDGYRKARIELLGKDAVEAEEQGESRFLQLVLDQWAEDVKERADE